MRNRSDRLSRTHHRCGSTLLLLAAIWPPPALAQTDPPARITDPQAVIPGRQQAPASSEGAASGVKGDSTPTPGKGGESADELNQTEQNLRSFLATHESAVDAHYLLAYTLFREAKAKDSLAEYTRAAALRTPSAKDLQTVALNYALLNDYEDADHWMTESVARQPQNFEAWYELGRIRYSRSRVADALECFQKALTIEPRSVKAENNLGLALEALNRTDEAIAAYRQAIAWQEGTAQPSEQPLINLAIVLGNRSELAGALELLQRAQHIAPHDAKVCEQLGRMYARMGNLPQAQAALEQAAILKPDVAAIHFELGQVYRRQDKSEQAKSEFARAAALNGTHSSDRQP